MPTELNTPEERRAARCAVAAPVIARMRELGIYAPDGYRVDPEVTDIAKTFRRHGFTPRQTRIEYRAVEVPIAA